MWEKNEKKRKKKGAVFVLCLHFCFKIISVHVCIVLLGLQQDCTNHIIYNIYT